MTAPRRQHGLTAAQRAAQCTGKQRYADEATARAIGMSRHAASGTALWVYACPQCRGWHLTRCDNGPAANVMADPAGLADALR
jgi:hypothetical protein